MRCNVDSRDLDLCSSNISGIPGSLADMRDPKPDQADTTAPCRPRLAMGCTLVHQCDPLLRRARAQLAVHGRWDDLILNRWHTPTSSSLAGMSDPKPVQADTTAPCRPRLAMGCTLMHQMSRICAALEHSLLIIGIGKIYSWTDGTHRLPAARMDVSTASVHLDQTRPIIVGAPALGGGTLY